MKKASLEIHQVLLNGERPLRGKLSARLNMMPEDSSMRPIVIFKNGRKTCRLEFDCLFPGPDVNPVSNQHALLCASIFARIGFLKVWVEYKGDDDVVLFELHLGKEIFEVDRPRSEVD